MVLLASEDAGGNQLEGLQRTATHALWNPMDSTNDLGPSALKVGFSGPRPLATFP